VKRGARAAVVVTAFAATGVGALVACSSDDSAPPAGVPDAAVADAGPVPEASPPPDVFVPTGYDGGLGIPLVDVPDTPCGTRGGTPAVVVAADAGTTTTFGSLHSTGARWLASSSDGASVLAINPDGTSAAVSTSATVGGGAVNTIGGQAFLAGGVNFASVVVQPIDTNGAAVGAPIDLAAEDPEGMGVATNDTAMLVAWGTPTGIRARGFTPDGVAVGTAPYDLAVTSRLDEPTIRLAYWDQGLFGGVFSGRDGSEYLTAFGRGSTGGRTDDPHALFAGPVARRVAGLTKATGGYALLMSVDDGSQPYAMLMLLDVGGRPRTSGLKLLGSVEAAAIAVNGDEVGVLAVKGTKSGSLELLQPVFRPFSATTGEPLGPWVCLDTPGPQIELGGGLAPDGAGYAAVYKASDGSASFVRFDHLGTGGP
jgi:hypothetical protein